MQARLIWQAIIAAALLALAPVGTAHAQEDVSEHFHQLENLDGSPASFASADYDYIVLVATWCPYSAEFARIASVMTDDGRIGDKRLAFIVADEWGEYEIAATEEGFSDREKRRLKAKLLEESPYKVVLADPDMIASYPGDIYIFPDDPKHLQSLGFPASWNPESDMFDEHGALSLYFLGAREEELAMFAEEE